MKKVIILRKIQVTMKTFAPPFFIHFSLSLNRKKACGNESHEKETNLFMLQLQICYILEQEILISTNADLAKNEVIAFVVERCMQCLPFRQNPGAHRKHLAIHVLWATAQLLATRVSLMYLVYEFFSFPVQLNEMRMLGEFKVLSFCFLC